MRQTPAWFHQSLAALLFLLLTLVGCRRPADPQVTSSATATPLSFAAYENKAGLNLIYPMDWEYVPVTEGLLLFGEPETISLERPGASVTVFRLPPESAGADLQQTFDHYVENGPLQSGYQTVTETASGTLGGREALEISVEKGETDDQPAMRVFITGAQTESGVTYILAAAAPQADWDEHWLTFQLLLQSVEFNE
ncbi:MAG TPA: hypothetical protein VF177_19745 [Anaerolineae bacterium]